MPCTIKRKSDFSYVRNHGLRIKSSSVITVFAKSPQESVAYIASKRIVGKAVRRNKAKRRLRSLVQEFRDKIKSGLFLFIATSKTASVDFSKLKSDFLCNLNKINND